VSEDQLDRLSDREKIQLIFLPGFSTSEEITDISGRGVGMDVVKTNIERLRGRIQIDSTMGEGTGFHLIVPLTLAIVPSLILGSGDTRFALPQVNIKEVLFLEPGQIHGQTENLAGSEVLRLRDCLVPVLRLRNVLGIKTYVQASNLRTVGPGERFEEKRRAIADRRRELVQGEDLGKRGPGPDRRLKAWDPVYVVILKLGENLFGLCVEELYDIEELVIEPLPEHIKHLKNFAGAGILGDGDVTMVLDVPGIAAGAHLKFDPIRNEEFKRNRQQQKAAGERGEMRSLLVFGTKNQEYFALELKHIARIEPLQPLDIHYTGRLKYMEYQCRAVPLFSMDELLPATAWQPADQEMFVIFPKHVSTRAGIVASAIIDTMETDRLLQRDASWPEPVLGKLFVNDMMVQVLDHEKIADLMDQNSQLKAAPATAVPTTGSDPMQDQK
jgi:two-component system chemotaxis sensor kinase CheA